MRRLACLLALFAAPAAAGPPAPLSDADFLPVDRAEAELGRDLFYDPILSGNRSVACASCHHPRFGTADGVSLGLGDGGVGLGPSRKVDPENPPEDRVPRHSPALFNLGVKEVTRLFADGRVEVDDTRKAAFRTPLEDDMPRGFDGILSAQTMFPVLSPDEMAGHYSENDVSAAVRSGRITGAGGAWDLIARRVAAIPSYADRFALAYPHIEKPSDLDFADVSNAIAAFVAFEWRSDDSAFDRHLRGEAPLRGAAAEGMALFYGPAECATCHSGPLLTDHDFHAMGMPQFGPGKAESFERHAQDTGRFRVTGDPAHLYAFRTPSLRNVAATAPYGHSGAYRTLESFLAAHADPARALAAYAPGEALLPDLPGAEDWWVLERPEEVAAIAGSAVEWSVPVTDADITDLVAFLGALSDPVALGGRLGVPESVPSGLPVPR